MTFTSSLYSYVHLIKARFCFNHLGHKRFVLCFHTFSMLVERFGPITTGSEDNYTTARASRLKSMRPFHSIRQTSTTIT